MTRPALACFTAIILASLPLSASEPSSSPLVPLSSSPSPVSRRLLNEGCGEEAPLSTSDYLTYILGSALCVVIGAIMSGLQVGYFSIDPMKLRILMLDNASNPRDKARARLLSPLLAKHHWLLVTLLIANAAAMETLPIMLDHLVSPYIAIILSVSFILFFGEIVPQALCTKEPLKIGAFFAPFIKLMMLLTSPLGYPVARLLDYILGHEGGAHFLLAKTELNALVELHGEGEGGHLEADQVRIMKGALSFSESRVDSVMTPMKYVFMVEIHRNVDFELLNEIFKSGYSRIPCYDKNLPSTDNIVGLLIVKDLILIDPQESTPIRNILNFYPHPIEKVFADQTLDELLAIMKTGRSHMALVHEIRNDGPGDPYRINLGIITLEDIVEAVLGTEIQDETDQFDEEMAEFEGIEALGNRPKRGGRWHLANRYARRRLPQRLTPQELKAVQGHLIAQDGDIFGKLSEAALKRIILSGTVTDVKLHEKNPRHNSNQAGDATIKAGTKGKVAPSDLSSPSLAAVAAAASAVSTLIENGGRVLYQRGVASDYLTVVLDGSILVRAGAEGFSSELRNWSTIGRQAMLGLGDDAVRNAGPKGDSLPAYIPDFTATVNASSRVLRIPRLQFVVELRRELGLPASDAPIPEPIKPLMSPSSRVSQIQPSSQPQDGNAAARKNHANASEIEKEKSITFVNDAGSKIEASKTVEVEAVELILTRNAAAAKRAEQMMQNGESGTSSLNTRDSVTIEVPQEHKEEDN